MNGLALRFPTWLAVLANSLIFAAMHLGNPNVSTLALVNLTLAGLTFSLLFAYTENIWFVGAAHSAWNFVQGPVLGTPGIRSQPAFSYLAHPPARP